MGIKDNQIRTYHSQKEVDNKVDEIIAITKADSLLSFVFLFEH